jgi:hypothetical protein
MYFEHVIEPTSSPGGYYQALNHLLQLAPKTKYPNVVFGDGNNKGQSILITHHVDGRLVNDGDQSSSDECGDGDDDDDLDDLFEQLNAARKYVDFNEDSEVDGSQNSLSHNKFLMSSIVQQHLCFEISTGLPMSTHTPEWIPRSSAKHMASQGLNEDDDTRSKLVGPVLFPGSLRENGDFCILQLSLVEQSSFSPRKYAWEVQKVNFHTINKFG